MDSTSAVSGREAAYWRPDGDAVRCGLCPHRCRIPEGRKGICGIRENRGGVLYAATYGTAAAVALDPIEKKPLFHFHPGTDILSIGGIGCNFRCGFCQNFHLVEGAVPVSPVDIGALLSAARRDRSIGIAYTYNEPLISFEFVRDCAREFRRAGMVNVLVTNGFVNPEPLAELLPLVDAMNIDLKSMDPAFYASICRGRLDPVLETIRTCAGATHVELTNLLVTGKNDSDDAIRKIVEFVAETDPEIPLHFSRYFPAHRFTEPPTPPGRIEAPLRIARARLPYVYGGNIRLPGGEDTSCPRCRATVVRRSGYVTDASGLSGAGCASCGAPLRFVV